MEIHELNTFSGTLGSGDYFATDNGNDTSKVSAESMFAPLNARIDNIIAGPAPSAQEVTDARLGQNDVTYPSLGDAIRTQIDYVSKEPADLMQAYQTKKLSVVGGWVVTPFTMVAGVTYIITSTRGGGVAYTYDGTANVEQFIDGETSVEFTPTKTTSHIRSWFGGNGSNLTISVKNSLELSTRKNTPIFKLGVSLFEHGNLSQGRDDDYYSSNRIRTERHYSINDIEITALTANARVSVDILNAAGEFVSNTGWKTNYTIPKETVFRALLTSDANAAETKTIEEVYACFSINVGDFHDITEALQQNDLSSIFEHGNIFNGNNDTWHEDARIRNIVVVKCANDLYIRHNDGAYWIVYYNADGSYKETVGALTSDRIIPAGTKFRLIITQDSDSTESASIETILSCISINEIDAHSYGLSPNIIYQCRNVDETVYPPYSKWYIKAAAQNQFDRVRFNVWKTVDGYYFLCHNTTINAEARNMDGSNINDPVSTEGRTLAELNSYDWGIKYGSQYAGARVPMLEDALLFSAMYNLGVSIEFSQSQASEWTDTDTQNVIRMCDKYGITDNLIVIDANGMNINFLKKFVDHNPRTSVYIGGEESDYTPTMIDRINSLKTEYNKVYAQLYPWGTFPTDSFITLAKENNWILYNSITMSKADFLKTRLFGYGYGLIETNNVYMVKNTLRDWLNSWI